MTRPIPTRFDPVLGQTRQCPTCREWWPDDPEFFVAHRYYAGEPKVAAGRPYVRKTSGVSYQCHACHQRSTGKVMSLRRAVVERKSGFCLTPGCVVMIPEGREYCHGCAGRTAGPLTPDLIETLLFRFRWAA